METLQDVIEGADTVKKARELYLKRLPGQSLEAYENYLERAIFFNVTGKTLELYLSLIFSKAAAIHGIADASPLVQDCDLAGSSIEEFLEETTEEVLTVGRCGVLVDYAGSIEAGMSLADAEREEARPYLVRYPAESIIHWHTGRHGGKTILDRAVIKEKRGDTDEDDDIQYRELLLIDGCYTVRIWKKIASPRTMRSRKPSSPQTATQSSIPSLHRPHIR